MVITVVVDSWWEGLLEVILGSHQFDCDLVHNCL